MNGNWKSAVAKLARMAPTLFLRDPLFRYAAIAAGIALLFLIAQFAQNVAGPPTIPAAPAVSASGVPDRPKSAATAPVAPGVSPAAPLPAKAPTIAPGRPLDGIAVEPAPADTFGKLPKGAKSQ